MTASMSSRLRLLLDSVPLSRVDSAVLAAQEDQVLAWQLEIGSELGAENVPLAHVVLVVEGTLRVSGLDALGQPFTLRRIHAGEWWGLWSGLSGVAAATCRTTETTKVLHETLQRELAKMVTKEEFKVLEDKHEELAKKVDKMIKDLVERLERMIREVDARVDEEDSAGASQRQVGEREKRNPGGALHWSGVRKLECFSCVLT